MPENPVTILSTRPVFGKQLDNALAKGVRISVQSFIETSAVQNIEVQQELESISVQEAIVVFTSMNAVEAVIGMLDGHIPDWHIYCMGNTTQQLVAAYFGEDAIAGTGNDAVELAETLIENEVPDEVIFFCGNLRRDELPARLHQERIDVQEIVVYETTAIHHKVEEAYDGILFFSPSAAESFFATNQLPSHTVLFAIGTTTRDAIARFTQNRIVVSGQPGKDVLVDLAVKYFSGAR